MASPAHSSIPLRLRLGLCIDRWLAPTVSPNASLVVSGFWRSGTTWIQQALAGLCAAKRVHEPLHPLVPAARDLHAALGLAHLAGSPAELFLPYAAGARLPPPLHALFEQALRGAIPGVRRPRSGVAETLRRRVVVKLTRAQLCLATAHRDFGMPVIHIHRDPRAVVASIEMTDWPWLFDELRLEEQLLAIDDGRAAVFAPYAERIRDYDRRDRTARIAAYWALTERFVRDSCRDLEGVARVRYEQLVVDRAGLLRATLGSLGVAAKAVPDAALDQDSVTTARGRGGASVEERQSGWRQRLSAAQQATVVQACKDFDYEEGLDAGPSSPGAAGEVAR